MEVAGILPEDDRVELIEGEIVAMSPVGSRHAAHVARAQAALHGVVGDRAIVWVQNPIDLDDRSEPQPDVALLAPRPDFYEGRHPRPADVLLLLEVSDSAADYDRQVKLPLYARAGIAEVWLIDLAEPGRIAAHRHPTAAGFTEVEQVGRGRWLTVPGLADVAVAVTEVVG